VLARDVRCKRGLVAINFPQREDRGPFFAAADVEGDNARFPARKLLKLRKEFGGSIAVFVGDGIVNRLNQHRLGAPCGGGGKSSRNGSGRGPRGLSRRSVSSPAT
jgi:hypothetical protein